MPSLSAPECPENSSATSMLPRPMRPLGRITQTQCRNWEAMAAVVPEVNQNLTRQRQVLFHPRCPRGMAFLPGKTCEDINASRSVTQGFCIDRFEASLVRESVATSGASRTEASSMALSPYVEPRTIGGSNIVAVSVDGVVPQSHISGSMAERACQAGGKRLCTPREWQRACLGPQFFCSIETCQLPSSRDFRPCRAYNQSLRDRCNRSFERHAGHPAAALQNLYSQSSPRLGAGANRNYLPLITADYCINMQADTVWLTGHRSGASSDCDCRTEEGICDLVGNVHEWTGNAGTHAFRGGYYADTSINGVGCLYATPSHSFNYHDYSTGFRCCADALPAGASGP